MIVQILENLISNSVYWIKQLQVTRRSFEGKLTIQIDRINERIQFTDNGPGIPCERKEEIFLPFISTKPPGEGKGLGLYISRELAKYHKASLTLKDETGSDYLNTFILSLKTT
jgi:signal transduction histidine kinase